jgi:predicted YcjX-like family ATPase
MYDVPAAASEVRRIAGAGLAAGEPVTVAPGRWPIVLSGLDFHRLTGIALTAFESGNLVLSDEQV